MKTLNYTRIPALLALLAVAACDDAGTDLAFEDLTPEEELELAVLADPGSFDIAVELTDVSNDVAAARGDNGLGEAQGLNLEARAAFADARAAFLAGDRPAAVRLARAARRLVARALIATGGVPAVEDLIERLEDLLMTVDAELFDDPDALRAELETIIAEARALLEAGDSVEAAARALLGEQRARLRRGHHHRPFDIGVDRARFEVALAGTAVSLATRLLAEDAVPQLDAASAHDRQNRWLAHAQKLLEKAETALSNGNLARAVHYAWHAQWSALKAVILPGGITEEELRAMVELAEELHEQAEAALGDEPTEFELRVFNRAGDLIEIGVRKLQEGHKRGVAALWRSSIMSAWLIG